MTIGFIYYLEAVILMTLLPKSWRDTAIGLLCVLVHPLMYKVPCNRLVRVCETKRLEHMSFSGSVHGFLNAGCWLSYGLLRDEPFIITCSAANFVFGIVQLSVYAYYYFNYPQPKSCTTNDERTAESSNAVSEPEKTSNIDDEKTAQNELLLPLLEDMV
ncbi:bidirectional sugar transporter SWEET7-like [Papaver somniferum]|uniref:bidirectional sugar transporter SWEET7-like n=1 Tax=Papaver somniferum TaxID=3469 RepID=UPI000E6FA53C|nr:bidirectional sugar transporter SWEET7-like [Papaver somniferum]